MDALSHQLLSDQVSALQRLGGAHDGTDTLLRRSIVCAFEAISADRERLIDSDWRQLASLLTELDGVMTDDEFVYSGYALPRGRVDVDLRPFLREIREHHKIHGNVA